MTRASSKGKTNKFWTPEEDALLIEMIGKGASRAAVARTVNRSRSAVTGRLERIKPSLARQTPKVSPAIAQRPDRAIITLKPLSFMERDISELIEG